ncbi:hypothetical protein HDU83_009369 [Entophlyctis luteolus]|nr:hypothetical protein HDU83_009369 [Entophlyctis luteolus]
MAATASVDVTGRAKLTAATGSVCFGYPGVSMRLRFTGTRLSAVVSKKHPSTSYLLVLVDAPARVTDSTDPSAHTVAVDEGDGHQIVLADNLANSEHEIEIVHQTETWIGILEFASFATDGSFPINHVYSKSARKLLFVGDSVTCGEALDLPANTLKTSASWNAFDSYGMRIARAFGAQCHLVSYGGRGLIRDYLGTPTWTGPKMFEVTIPDDKLQEPWNHAEYTPDAVFVSLCTNDLALGIPDEREFVDAFVAFVKRIRAVHPNAFVFITEGSIVNNPPNENKTDAQTKTIMQKYLHQVVTLADDQKIRAVPSNYYPGTATDAHPINSEHASMAKDFIPIFAEALGWSTL